MSTTNSGTGGDRAGLSGADVYETTTAVDEYVQFHYGAAGDVLPYPEGPQTALDFIPRCASMTWEAHGASAGQKGARVLDIGCSVGGISFELTKYYEEVLGIDFSHMFVDAAKDMKEKGTRQYQSKIQADLVETRTANLDPEVDRQRAHFEQGDACNLREDIGTFDAIIGSNLICRLPDPEKFLTRLPSLIKSSQEGVPGVLVLVSPFSWLEEYTPKDKWIGGYLDKDGQRVDSHESLETILAPSFKLEKRFNIPFMIREHARKYQWGISDVTVWHKK